MPPRKKPAGVSVDAKIIDTEVGLAQGDAYVAPSPRGPRVIVVERIDWSTGTPRALAREVAPPCPHAFARALGGGACVLCPPAPSGGIFEIALTFRLRQVPEVAAWHMPAPYAPAPHGAP